VIPETCVDETINRWAVTLPSGVERPQRFDAKCAQPRNSLWGGHLAPAFTHAGKVATVADASGLYGGIADSQSLR